MKRFLLTIILFLAIPLVLLLSLYLLTDPYKTLKPFSLEYFDDTNRDYLSSSLFLMNYPSQQYDSYIFGSSKACGINSWHWLNYLPEGSRQFLLQGWGETLTGMEQKIAYIHKHGYPLKNVLLLIDYPNSFKDDQQPNEVISMKHPVLSGQSRWVHQAVLFGAFAQKPSQWVKAFQSWNKKTVPAVGFDPVSNDWYGENRYRDVSAPPVKDSLYNCSVISRNVFLKEIEGKTDDELPTCDPVITEEFEEQLRQIKRIFDDEGTDYRVVVSPGYCYTSPKVNLKDDEILRRVFGDNRVFDFSGKNYMTEDYNNYSDPNHFGLWVGWWMIEEIYGDRSFELHPE